MPSISFGGLATGLDTGAIISQLLEIKRQPIYRLEERKLGFQAEIKALGDLKSKLLALQEAAQGLDTASEFNTLMATSSDEDILQVTAGSDAAPGSYKIVVNSRAMAQKDLSQGFDSAADSVGTGSISFTIGGEVTQLDLTEFTSVGGLANKINDEIEGINATVIFDGAATGGYRLMLSSDDAGTSQAYTVDASGLSGGIAPVFTNQQAAADASLTIDDTITVTTSSNSPSDVIAGLTLDLRNADPATAIYVDVERDVEGIAEKVKGLVDAYNDLAGFVATESASAGRLDDNPTLRSVSRRIENIFTSALSDGVGSLRTFSSIGVTRGDGRQYKFNEDDFSAVLTESYGAVRDLLVERDGNVGKASLIDTAVENMTDSISGLFKNSTEILNDKIGYADDAIARYERSAESYRVTLERKFTAMELMVSQLQAQGGYLGGIYG